MLWPYAMLLATATVAISIGMQGGLLLAVECSICICCTIELLVGGLSLQVYATADSPRYECSAPAPAIVFRPTMMFQTRSFTFSITNSALTALKYQWMVLDKHGNLDESGELCRWLPVQFEVAKLPKLH